MNYVSYIILGIIVIVYITSLNNLSVSSDLINYPLRAFQHANLNHIAANAISFFSLSFIEGIMGHEHFLMAMIFIWIVSSLLLYGYHSIFPSRKIKTVGFSAVIFGLIVIYYTLLGSSKMITFVGLAVSIVPQLAVSGISHEGHICGIIAGILYVTFFPVKSMANMNKTGLLK